MLLSGPYGQTQPTLLPSSARRVSAATREGLTQSFLVLSPTCCSHSFWLLLVTRHSCLVLYRLSTVNNDRPRPQGFLSAEMEILFLSYFYQWPLLLGNVRSKLDLNKSSSTIMTFFGRGMDVPLGGVLVFHSRSCALDDFREQSANKYSRNRIVPYRAPGRLAS